MLEELEVEAPQGAPPRCPTAERRAVGAGDEEEEREGQGGHSARRDELHECPGERRGEGKARLPPSVPPPRGVTTTTATTIATTTATTTTATLSSSAPPILLRG